MTQLTKTFTPITYILYSNATDKKNSYKNLQISFAEYDCKSETPIVDFEGFACAQLTGYKTLYRDTYGQRIEVEVHYNDGCELRCTTKKCRKRNLLKQALSTPYLV